MVEVREEVIMAEVESTENTNEVVALEEKNIVVCCGTGCIAGGSLKIIDRLTDLLKANGIKTTIIDEDDNEYDGVGIKKANCFGFCVMGPLLKIEPMGWMYTKVAVEDCEEIIEKSILGNEYIERLVYHDKDGTIYPKQDEIPFFKKKSGHAMEQCDQINAIPLTEYVEECEHQKVAKAVFDMNKREIVDVNVDFDKLMKMSSEPGFSDMVVLGENSCMVEVARFFMNFTLNESCGKCVPCREGAMRMLEILNDIVEGNSSVERIQLLEEVAETVLETSLCVIGVKAARPVLSTLKYFRDEYESHVTKKICPACQCKALISFEVDPDKCKGCTKCARMCPVKAISGELKMPHSIDKTKCIRCRACIDGCAFKAIHAVNGKGDM